MISQTNARFWDAYARLPEDVKQQARRAYRTFRRDPYYPGLQFKQVHVGKSVYSARIGLHYRTLGVRRDELIVWFWIGHHDEYDKIISRL